jgi:hypothetical protein
MADSISKLSAGMSVGGSQNNKTTEWNKMMEKLGDGGFVLYSSGLASNGKGQVTYTVDGLRVVHTKVTRESEMKRLVNLVKSFEKKVPCDVTIYRDAVKVEYGDRNNGQMKLTNKPNVNYMYGSDGEPLLK